MLIKKEKKTFLGAQVGLILLTCLPKERFPYWWNKATFLYATLVVFHDEIKWETNIYID